MNPEEQVPPRIRAVNEPTETVREQDKIMLVLSYFGVFSLIPLLTVKDSEYVRWHAKNGLVLSLGGGIALSVLSTVVGWIPILGCFVVPFLWIGFLVVLALAISKALRGIRWRVPGVTELAEKL